MKIHSEEDIINEVESLKGFLKTFDSKWETKENKIFVFNKLNKIIRMMKKPIRRIDLNFKYKSKLCPICKEREIWRHSKMCKTCSNTTNPRRYRKEQQGVKEK